MWLLALEVKNKEYHLVDIVYNGLFYKFTEVLEYLFVTESIFESQVIRVDEKHFYIPLYENGCAKEFHVRWIDVIQGEGSAE